MRSGRSVFFWALVIVACEATAAHAQWFGARSVGPYGYSGFGYPAVGVGVVSRNRGTFFGLGFGFFPGAYSSSWGNGYSLYGPPVSPYGPTPGAFGGTGADLSLGNPWYRREDSYYRIPYASRPGLIYAVPTAPFRANERLGPQPLPPEIGGAETAPLPRKDAGTSEAGPVFRPSAPIQIEVIVPFAEAKLIFDGHATTQTGKTRVFSSPPLAPGRTYTYTITMQYQIDGRPQSETRQVEAQPGTRARVDFTLP